MEPVPGVENEILMIRACRSIEDLCIYGELTMYRYQNKLTCDTCDDNTNREVRKNGEFSYDFEAEGMDFKDVNLPRKFRGLKYNVEQHIIKSEGHKTASLERAEKDKQEDANKIYNMTVGPKLAKIVYSNNKERDSYAKYPHDVAYRTSNGEGLEILIILKTLPKN